MASQRIGVVTHYYDRIRVAVITLKGMIRVGDRVQFLGRNTDFEQQVTSLQIEHEYIGEAGAGQEVALKVVERVRPNDGVYKLAGEEK